MLSGNYIDPIEYDLFLRDSFQKVELEKIEHNGEIFSTVSLVADVDNDISYDRRSEVIEYIEKNMWAKLQNFNLKYP